MNSPYPGVWPGHLYPTVLSHILHDHPIMLPSMQWIHPVRRCILEVRYHTILRWHEGEELEGRGAEHRLKRTNSKALHSGNHKHKLVSICNPTACIVILTYGTSNITCTMEDFSSHLIRHWSGLELHTLTWRLASAPQYNSTFTHST